MKRKKKNLKTLQQQNVPLVASIDMELQTWHQW